MTAADLIRICLDLDKQVISPRPSAWGEAALLVRDMARICKADSTDEATIDRLGDIKEIRFPDLKKRPLMAGGQPTLSLVDKYHRAMSVVVESERMYVAVLQQRDECISALARIGALVGITELDTPEDLERLVRVVTDEIGSHRAVDQIVGGVHIKSHQTGDRRHGA